MTKPFEDPDGSYLVLVNGEGEHSLWPAFLDVPAGWRIAHGAAGYQASLAYVEEHAIDARDRGLTGIRHGSGA